MSIHLNKPYKIIRSRHKRYESHYGIPSAEVVVIPLRQLGADVSCDIRWEDANGQLHVIQQAMFSSDNLEPLNELLDVKLHEIWSHYYSQVRENDESQ
ncbi:MAG TPA: hypothetical protein VD927_17595 [Chryseosolibacter sp.]|nr:hypothetical protein [Chryseosolibacter sp.]